MQLSTSEMISAPTRSRAFVMNFHSHTVYGLYGRTVVFWAILDQQ